MLLEVRFWKKETIFSSASSTLSSLKLLFLFCFFSLFCSFNFYFCFFIRFFPKTFCFSSTDHFKRFNLLHYFYLGTNHKPDREDIPNFVFLPIETYYTYFSLINFSSLSVISFSRFPSVFRENLNFKPTGPVQLRTDPIKQPILVKYYQCQYQLHSFKRFTEMA